MDAGTVLTGLFDAARAAMARTHSPYSKFPVGCAILTSDGRVFAGANMENVAFPEGWCAETTALAHFVMAGGGTISDVCVTAARMDRITPCGGCRQRLAEFTHGQTRLHLTDQSGIVETLTMAEVLPGAFRTEILS